MKPAEARHGIDYYVRRLETLKQRSMLSSHPDYQAVIRSYREWLDWAAKQLIQQRLDPYEQGKMQGLYEALQEFCLDGDELAKKIHDVTNKIASLQGQAKAAEQRSWREPPPASNAQPSIPRPHKGAVFMPGG